ncbi:MAG: UDP-N-acetylmuramoyl-L-alanyl-D-glutamate--2,6-diaminopimelate ligase [Candidatus Parcubacteria bacterium]|nr:UDP-N-acetylmuramoyl-L-alanyl-D-glutamate--2,6-diaminopimelate ligase [Candidatus Parcubacteria bacterium]
MASFRKKIMAKIRKPYHYLVPYLSARRYRYPSNKLIVIGITGTKGKTTVANMLWHILEAAGFKTGLLGTANIKISGHEELNTYHMTMLGQGLIQKYLNDMVNAGCKYAIVETTSEGIKQWRHKAINYDVAVFTNLYPEHIEAHGSWMKYRNAKGNLFNSLKHLKHKQIEGKTIPKIIIINTDDSESKYFSKFWADQKFSFGLKQPVDYQAKDIILNPFSSDFKVKEDSYHLSLPGEFNVINALTAVTIAQALKIDVLDCQKGISDIKDIPGRMERIPFGKNGSVFVDYAHEEQSFRAALKAVSKIKEEQGGKIIVLMGAAGNRDKIKRLTMAQAANEMADLIVVSNEDPYDEDPQTIVDQISDNLKKLGCEENIKFFKIFDRREGINKAISLAEEKDVVLITGKGAEQCIVVKGEKIPWDDRQVVREEIRKIYG